MCNHSSARLGIAATHMFAGITTVCDMGTMGAPSDTWDTLENIYMPVAGKGQLGLRIFAMAPLPSWYTATLFTPVPWFPSTLLPPPPLPTSRVWYCLPSAFLLCCFTCQAG